MVTNADRDLTEGSLLGPLVALAAPIVVTQLLQVAYNRIDTFWVDRLGQDAVTALSFSWPPVFVLISVGGGITLAGSVLVALLGWGTDGAWFAVAFMHVGAAVVATAWFATGSWTENVIDESDDEEDAPVVTPAD